MPSTIPRSKDPFVAVGYEDNIVFVPSPNNQGRPDLHATWQQSQGLWTNHPVFHGMAIREVIAWLRGGDSDL